MFRRSTVELTAPTPTIESTAKESVSAEKISIEGRSVDRVAIARESKGTWITGGCRERDADYRSGKRETTFFPVYEKMTVDGRDITQMIAEEGKATSWRLRESIRVRELAADAQTRANTSFPDARGAEDLEARVRLQPY